MSQFQEFDVEGYLQEFQEEFSPLLHQMAQVCEELHDQQKSHTQREYTH